MELSDFASSAEVIIGLLVTAFGLLAGVGTAVARRVRAVVASSVSGLHAGHVDIEKRLRAVEDGQGRTDRDLRKIETRVGGIEARMGQLASKSDVSNLAITLAKVEATGAATSGMVDSLHRGLLALAERKDT